MDEHTRYIQHNSISDLRKGEIESVESKIEVDKPVDVEILQRRSLSKLVLPSLHYRVV